MDMVKIVKSMLVILLLFNVFSLSFGFTYYNISGTKHYTIFNLGSLIYNFNSSVNGSNSVQSGSNKVTTTSSQNQQSTTSPQISNSNVQVPQHRMTMMS